MPMTNKSKVNCYFIIFIYKFMTSNFQIVRNIKFLTWKIECDKIFHIIISHLSNRIYDFSNIPSKVPRFSKISSLIVVPLYESTNRKIV